MLQNLHLSRRRKPSINLKSNHFTSTDLIHLHCSRINHLCGDNIHLKRYTKKEGGVQTNLFRQDKRKGTKRSEGGGKLLRGNRKMTKEKARDCSWETTWGFPNSNQHFTDYPIQPQRRALLWLNCSTILTVFKVPSKSTFAELF